MLKLMLEGPQRHHCRCPNWLTVPLLGHVDKAGPREVSACCERGEGSLLLPPTHTSGL